MLRKYLLVLFLLIVANFLHAQNLSNRGKEFWLGYGHNTLFDITPINSQQLVLYLSTEQAANVTVAVNGTPFSQTYNIPANSIRQSIEIPKTGANDARIRSEGMHTRGIYISSDVPIVAYAHQYGGNSSGATMLMPVETFGYTYYSLNYTQESNANSPSYSWFFIVASENNTRVEITPSALTEGGRQPNVPFTVDLQRGQIYNVFGKATVFAGGSTGQDLTGSKIRSIPGSDGVCHPIGVFSGASRMVICGQSGEFMQQQIFPASAWGTKYLTYPTVRTNNIALTNINFYRVAVRDPATVVRRNGVVLTNLINNFYYEFSGSAGEYIEADNPVLVGQYVPSEQPNAGCTYFGVGDPEMFFLSPVEQAINRATFYATSNQNINNTFVSVIIPENGMNTLTLNGSNVFDVVRAHPQNPAYRVAIKRLTPNAQYTLQSDSTFTAITYGLGGVESYGYNAGTMVNNLDAIPAIENIFSQTGANSFTCPNSPFHFSVNLTYKPTQMIWRFSQVNNIVINQDTTLNNPVPTDSLFIGSRMFYKYKLPRSYYFTDTGTYTIPVSITSPNIDNCNNTVDISFTVKVNPPPRADFSINYTGCKLDSAFFSGTLVGAGFTGDRYRWTFPDGSTDSLKDVAKLFPADGTSNVRLTAIADNGCIGDTIKPVITSPPPTATFGISPAAICEGGTVTFTDTSSYNGGSIQNWYWDFGNGVVVNAPTNAPQTQTYNTRGNYTIKHFAQAGSCVGDTSIKTLTVFSKPDVSFILPAGCLPDSMARFINTSTVPDGQVMTYQWNFGNPLANAANPNTSTEQNPSHKYSDYGPFNVSLTVTTANGCSNSLTIPFTPGGFSTAVNYTILNRNSLCVKDPVQVRNDMNVVADSIYRIDIYWDLLNQPGVFTQVNNPAANAIYSNQYPTYTTPGTKEINIKWVVYNRGGCMTERTEIITLHALPVLSFDAVYNVCVNNSPFPLQASATNVQGNGVYNGNGTSAAGMFNPAQAGVGTHQINYIFTSSGGCIDSINMMIEVLPQPTANFGFTNVCINDSTRFTDSSFISSGNIVSWSWNFGDGTTSVVRPPFNKLYDQFGTFNVQLTVVSDSGCTSQVTKPLRVNAQPVVDFEMPPSVCLPGGVASFNNISTLPNGAVSELSFAWNFGDGNSSTSFNGANVYADSNAYIISLTATSAAGCVSNTSKSFNSFFKKPVADFEVSAIAICQGKETIFIDKSVAPSSNISSYLWRFGDGSTSTDSSPVKVYNIPGLYTISLQVTTAEGCTADTSQVMRVYLQPKVDAGVSVFIPEGTDYQLQPVVNDTNLLFRWTPANFLSNANVLQPIFRAVQSQWLTLTATGEGNCSGMDTVRITVLKTLNVPNAFSPNGDGINDTWNIPNLADYPGNAVEVYDRYGRSVFRTIGYSMPWNGTMNGKPLPVGTYYYIIDLKQPGYRQITGSITILK